MLGARLTPEAAEALANLIKDQEVAGRSRDTFSHHFGPRRHQCVDEWRDRIRANLQERRLPFRRSH